MLFTNTFFFNLRKITRKKALLDDINSLLRLRNGLVINDPSNWYLGNLKYDMYVHYSIFMLQSEKLELLFFSCFTRSWSEYKNIKINIIET